MHDRQAKPQREVRCAIYTRKSTEEGLEQEFNSLDAQREACAAFILSQRHEGWALVPEYYDDGGFSGGNMDRPGLKQLLADVASDKVNVIVVYKVDRLTRSLRDFSKIVEVLEQADASFVSVTQAFNTTSSMGRLMLNVLLSFAQFEREVTGERIRDKVAASKKKGMWMGGPVPLGFRLEDRKLVSEPAEAETVRYIFDRYIALGSGRLVVAELDAQGIRSKPRINRYGRTHGSAQISRGALYIMLQNRLYIGKVTHKGESYDGQHDGIVDPEIFANVQRLIDQRRVERRLGTNARDPSLLAGLIVDAHGRRMSPSHTGKSGKRYRYYCSQTDGDVASAIPVWRVSSGDIEGLICARLADAIHLQIRDRIAAGDLDGTGIELLGANAQQAAEQLSRPNLHDARALLLQIVQRIEVAEDRITIAADFSAIDGALAPEPLTVGIPIGIVRSGKTVRLLIPPVGGERARHRNPALLKLVAQAFIARRAIEVGDPFDEVARRLGYGREYLADMIRTSHLSPSIITAIIDGKQPLSMSRKQLVTTNRIPLDWNAQHQMFGLN